MDVWVVKVDGGWWQPSEDGREDDPFAPSGLHTRVTGGTHPRKLNPPTRDVNLCTIYKTIENASAHLLCSDWKRLDNSHEARCRKE